LQAQLLIASSSFINEFQFIKLKEINSLFVLSQFVIVSVFTVFVIGIFTPVVILGIRHAIPMPDTFPALLLFAFTSFLNEFGIDAALDTEPLVII
jgi:hypothetical protein